MPRIQQLDAHVVNQIAAGEVIERPASVVKELLENSVDALATRIEIDIEEGGNELIRVVDDGEGIHPDDFPLAVSSHATSKLGNADDLFRIQTLGFRGEALASIAEVSRFRLRSRQPDADEGRELEVTTGVSGPLRVCGCPRGTQIEIRELFANTPVRRKFLKSTSTEFGHISEQFTRIALAHPRLHLVLRHNQKMVYELPSTTHLLDRIRLFFGSEMADQLIWVESQHEETRLWGYVGHPSQSKSTRKGQFLFLNGRWIQDRSLQHALTEAYRGLLMVGRNPISFLFLETPPHQVDVNVHPTKAEVRFRESQKLYRQLLSTLRTHFQGMNLDSTLRVAKPGGLTLQPLPPRADPERQHQLQQDLAAWARDQQSVAEAARDSYSDETASTLAAPFDGPSVGTDVADLDETSYPGYFPGSDGSQPFGDFSHRESNAGTVTDFAEPGLPPGPRFGTPGLSPVPGTENQFDEPAFPAYEPPPPRTPASMVPDSVRAMQIHDSYLVLETDEGMTVIDQHALHERILYEHLRHRVLSGKVESQRLLIPETVELSPAETALLQEHLSLLEQLGLSVSAFGGNTVLVTAYPVMLSRSNPARIVRDVAEQLTGNNQNPSRRDLLDELLHMMSCKGAIKAGQRLTPEEIESLLAQRHLIDDAHHCPHGRPTALVLSREELDRQFGRMG